MSTRHRRRPGPDAQIAATVHAAREYSTAAILFHQAVADRFGLSLTDLKTLDVLQRCGPMTAGAIAAYTGLATASVTSLIDRLERKRLLRRAPDPADRRRVVVTLTPVFERRIPPLFASLGVRMAARCRARSRSELALLRAFLAGAATDLRGEVARLAASRSVAAAPRRYRRR